MQIKVIAPHLHAGAAPSPHNPNPPGCLGLKRAWTSWCSGCLEWAGSGDLTIPPQHAASLDAALAAP